MREDTESEVASTQDAAPSGSRVLDRTLGWLIMGLMWVTFPVAAYLAYFVAVWSASSCTDSVALVDVVGAVAVLLPGAVTLGSSLAFARAARAGRGMTWTALGSIFGVVAVFVLVLSLSSAC